MAQQNVVDSWVDSIRASSPTHHKSSTHSDDLTSWMVHHPSSLNKFEEIINASKGKQIVVFLDYDGTLSPIFDDPDKAFMTDEMREAMRDTAKYFPTTIVSGRCRSKLFDFVELSELYYAGSHGMDIKEPVKGKELEIHPCIKWGKGNALEFLLESLGYANSNDVLPMYIDDDQTDEDAFKVLRDRGQGFGILVSKSPKETNASYSMQEPLEVMYFLNRLVEWKRSS